MAHDLGELGRQPARVTPGPHAAPELRDCFFHAPVPVWIADLSDSKRRVDALAEQGVGDVSRYLAGHPALVDMAAGAIQIVALNAAAAELLDVPTEAKVPGPATSYFGSGTLGLAHDSLVAIADGRREHEGDLTFVPREGEPRHLRLRWAVVPGHEATYDRVTISSLDVTDLIRDRAELAREYFDLRARLSQQATAIESILENVPAMIFVKDAQELRFVRLNKAGEDLLGYSREEMLGKNAHDLFPADEAEFFTGKDREVLEGRTLVDIPEEPIHTRSRGVRYVHTKKIPLLNEAGEPEHLLGISLDITQRKELEDTLRRHEAELERLNEALAHRAAELESANSELAQFAHAVSHDLRAPLVVVDGFARALAEDCADTIDRRARSYIGKIHAGVRMMNGLISDLLELSRISQSAVHRELVDLTALARSVTDELRDIDPTRVVEARIAEGLRALGDPDLLRVALTNLLGNAWKYTSKRPVAVVEFGVDHEAAGAAAFFVRDNGAGFDPAHADRLFTPFGRLHSREEFDGTGVGLATVQRIVHRHGGRIWAEGAPDGGATFWFTVPDAA